MTGRRDEIRSRIAGRDNGCRQHRCCGCDSGTGRRHGRGRDGGGRGGGRDDGRGGGDGSGCGRGGNDGGRGASPAASPRRDRRVCRWWQIIDERASPLPFGSSVIARVYHEKRFAAAGRWFGLARQLVLDAAVDVERLRVILVVLVGGDGDRGGRRRGCDSRRGRGGGRRVRVRGRGGADGGSSSGGGVEDAGRCGRQDGLLSARGTRGSRAAATAGGPAADPVVVMVMVVVMVVVMVMTVSMHSGTYHHFLLVAGSGHVGNLLLSRLPPPNRPFLHAR